MGASTRVKALDFELPFVPRETLRECRESSRDEARQGRNFFSGGAAHAWITCQTARSRLPRIVAVDKARTWRDCVSLQPKRLTLRCLRAGM
jgi:hypothetical protein